MTTALPMSIRGQVPFVPHSVHFNFPGGQAVRLREPIRDDMVGASPEWIAEPPRRKLVAYIRAAQPQIRVVFRGNPTANGDYIVGALGNLSDVGQERVHLAFDAVTELSAPVTLRLNKPLPDEIGVHRARFNWYIRDEVDPTLDIPVGTSTHRICTTWRAMSVNVNQGLYDWVYDRLMKWTCEWAAGCNDEKNICDAIIQNLPASGLRYGVPAQSPREILLKGGGMCGGWYRMFQQMVHCQGIFVHRRRFLVDWRSLQTGEELWCALVIRSSGLNQTTPTHAASDFYDNDTAFPSVAPIVLATRAERRYRFWGFPGYAADGHCINFLEYKGRLYLYDACFRVGPIEIDAPLPPNNLSVLGGTQLTSFKARYLDRAVDYMLGSLYNGTASFYQTVLGGTNGMTVRTALIPDVVYGNPGLTFYWGD